MDAENPTTAARREKSAAVFPVVGIGASAGGLEAYSQLFRDLPADTGMAYVLVQHLDPSHESHLVELISKISPLPIAEARDNQPIERDHVYIIPPNTYLTVGEGLLHLQPRPDGRGSFLPVDCLFASLAEDLGSQAIGVVLSGTGSDGTLGIRAIKGEGGITFAQDGTAPHDGMPRSAVSSECVDYILPPDKIASELKRISQHPYLAPNASAVDENSLQVLFQRLQQATRVDYSKYKQTTILRRIQRRIVLHRLNRLEDYVRFIEEHPAELEALHQDLLIHVTSFFRDPDAFEALTTAVFPNLVQDRPRDTPMRVWVPGCSTGEEVYSLAICLLEFLGDRDDTPIKLFGTDISDLALEKARAGKYPESITTHVAENRLHRFFGKREGGYQVLKAIRDLCVFARHDVTRDPPFSNLDLISCRNVLIYLGPALQKRVMPIFHYALRDRGFLLLGASETVGNLTELFNVADGKHKIYSRKATSRRLTLDFGSREEPFIEPNVAPIHSREVTNGSELQRETDRVVLAHYSPPAVVVDEEMTILQSRGQTGSFLALAPGVASLNLLKMAHEGLAPNLHAAIEEAKETNAPSRRAGLSVRANGHYLDVNIQVIPLTLARQRRFIVLFEDVAHDTAAEPAQNIPAIENDHRVEQLRSELAGTREYLHAIIEQLESSNAELTAANEEGLSSNEELLSTNEELQTAKEELQATNEELNTVNEELQHRNREVTQFADDLTNLFRTVNIPIVIVDADLRIRRFTPSAVELFNFIPSDAGRPISDIKPKLVEVDLQARILQALETLELHEEEVRDQEGRWHRLMIRPYRTQANRIEGAVVSVMDIDTLKRNEQAIKQARDYAESIIGTIQAPLLVLDSRLQVVSANASFYEVFGTAPPQVERRGVAELFDGPWDAAPLLKSLRETHDQDIPFKDLEITLTSPGPRIRILLFNGRRLLRPGPEPALLLVQIADITENRNLESRLREAQKMEAVGHLAAGIAHDFNNRLTVINGYCAVLKDRLAADAETKEMVSKISQAGEMATNLTRQLLAFSRKSMIAPKPFDLGALVTNQKTMLGHVIHENNRLEIAVAPGSGYVFADPALIEQAVLNLAINARDAMPEGGDLTIQVRNVDLDDTFSREHPAASSGPYVLLTVRDTGCGMNEQALTHAFEPFFTTKEVGQGTGLGLASVYGTVKQSSGFISVNSEPDHGTEFSIYLPRLPVPGADEQAAATPALIPKGGETLLLVEDSAEVRGLASAILKGAGYTVLEAEDGVQALEVAQTYQAPIHLLVTDVVMPRMDGHQLASRLVSLRPAVKVLFLSGYTPAVVVRNGIEQNVMAFLQKPYTPSTLALKVREILDSA